MALIDDPDIQVHLPVDKLKLEAIPDDVAEVKEYAERIIRGYLAGQIPALTLADWVDPDNTPATIRLIAGMFAAAKIYRVRYSEDSLDDPEFAQVTYDQAMSMLQGVINGTIVIEGVPTSGAGQFDNTYFYPNDTADDPIFQIGAQF